MALHFSSDEFAGRKRKMLAAMAERNLDAMLLFNQESMYWLTGYDTFGFCFFQCMIVEKSGDIALLTRSADLRQARHTSTVETITVWEDRAGSNPSRDLKDLLADRDLVGAQIGVEYDSAGLNGFYCRQLEGELGNFADLLDHSYIVSELRTIKSAAELKYVRKAATLADQAFEAAVPFIKRGGDEGDILAAMQGAVFAGGGDYAGNEFIIGSADDALLCRYKSGRRKLSASDQMTLEWAGAYRRYHAAMMTTVVTGTPSARHVELHEAAADALAAVEDAMQPGKTFGDVFEAHAKSLEDANLTRHRLNACGYSLGAHFTPCWMDKPMFYQANPTPIEADMSLFAHMIIMDSDSKTAMTLGRTYITTDGKPQRLSKLSLDLVIA